MRVVAVHNTAITRPEPRRIVAGEVFDLPDSWAEHYIGIGDVRPYGPTPTENKALPGPTASTGPKANRNARELAEKEGVDLSKVEGTGQAGRITVKDVLKFLGRE